MQKMLGISILVTCACISQAFGIDERGVIFRSLDHHPDIRILKIGSQVDSLTLASVESGWLPEISFSSIVSHDPLDANSSQPSVSVQGSVLQPLPGGGAISLGASQSATFPAEPYTSQFDSRVDLGVEQPLLKNAGRNGALDFQVRLARVSNEQLSISKARQLFSLVSNTRSLFWNYYEQTMRLTIAEQEQSRAQELLQSDRQRFVLGDAAPIDTLSAALEYLRANQRVLDARIRFESARNGLADALMISPDSLGAPDTAQIIIPDIPDETTLQNLVSRYDPELRIFERMAERLEIQLAKDRNSILPELNARGSIGHERFGNELFSGDPAHTNAVVSLVLKYALPLKQPRITIAKTELERRQYEINLQKYRTTLDTRIRELRHTWQQEKMRIIIAISARELAHKQLAAASKGYELGTIDRLTLLAARNDFTSAEISLVEAQISMKRLQIILDEITGTTFERFGVNIR